MLCHCQTVYKNIRVHESVLLLLLCVCIKSQKSGQLQLCMCVYICMSVCMGEGGRVYATDYWYDN